jgi:hypothetical protein
MKIGEVKKISLSVLKGNLADFGFSKADIAEDESFDGTPVFRINAEVTQKVPADVIVDTLDAIHTSLREKGEERIVFLTTKLPQIEGSTGAEEDVD